MQDDIRNNLNNPGQLEKLYRTDKAAFKQAFSVLYPELKDITLAEFWHQRLHYEAEAITWGNSRDLVFVLIASVLAGLIAKLPVFLSIPEDNFYPRNIGFIFLPLLIIYFARKNNLNLKYSVLVGVAVLASVVFINVLPGLPYRSDTLLLACLHLVLFIWSLLGVAFVGNNFKQYERRLDYLRYNGDLVVMTTLILISGALLTGITIGLFSLINFPIEQFYFQYIVVFGLAAAPIVGTYLTQTNPQLVSKVSPVIAKIFSPLVLVMLVVYLVAIIHSGKDPYNDRDFLLLFNALLIGVMALIFFSVAETSKSTRNQAGMYILLGLSLVTIVVNGIALSAILFRISEWGITPNRLAVLGGNILILLNLLLVTFKLFQTVSGKSDVNEVGNVIARYLPVYTVWTVIVVFVFPLIFGFK